MTSNARLGVRIAFSAGCGLDPLVHSDGDVDPPRVVPHLDRRVELERLVLEVEAQPGERLALPSKNRGRPAADDAVERRDPLLTVEDQDPEGRGDQGLAANQRAVGLGLPGQQAADRVPR